MLTKRLLAASLALTMLLPLAACGKDGEETQTTPHTDKVTMPTVIEDEENPIEKLPEGENEIIWMSHYDLNPSANVDRDVALTLFEDVYGGKIKYSQTSWNTRFDDLANAIMSNKDVPDIFPYEWIAVPCGVSKNMYQPIDSIVDFDDPLWVDVKQDAEIYAINGKHYVAPFYFDISLWLFYQKDKLADAGIADPYELYLEGNWTWDTFEEISAQWADLGEDYYPLTGAFADRFVPTTGQTLIVNDNGTFVDNTSHPDIERAMAWLYDYAKNGWIYDTYLGEPVNAFSSSVNILFDGIGPWAGLNDYTPTDENHGWGAVCIPLDPNTNEKICVSDMKAHMWVNGSTKDKAVKCWFECNRIAQTDEEYKAVDEQKFWANNPYWTQEMYDMYTEMKSPEFKKAFDFGYGVSDTIANNAMDRLYFSVTRSTDGVQNTYASVRADWQGFIQSELDAVNAAVAAME